MVILEKLADVNFAKKIVRISVMNKICIPNFDIIR